MRCDFSYVKIIQGHSEPYPGFIGSKDDIEKQRNEGTKTRVFVKTAGFL